MKQTTENLRYLLWKADIKRRDWIAQLAHWAQCDHYWAKALLRGAEPRPEEWVRIASAAGIPETDLRDKRLVEAEDILLVNLRHLLSTLRRGEKGALVTAIGVHNTTLSKWSGGVQRPTSEHLEGLHNYFGLPSDMDIRTQPVFLSCVPISDVERRQWLIERIQQLDKDTLRQLFPALERLLEEDELTSVPQRP
ncbi:MAG: hypothetical protein KKA73_22290 [Chloroflexi bacterium]|nr:hypothetical protein [Chloroflexota bacterium]MBU1750423.1 hypothetical protein [Chloroflexota bacterium]